MKIPFLFLSFLLQSCEVVELLPGILDPCGSYETQLEVVDNLNIKLQNQSTLSIADCEAVKKEANKLNTYAQACTEVSQSEKNSISKANKEIAAIDCKQFGIELQSLIHKIERP